MPSFASGPWGVVLLLLFALGLPLQLALGGLVAMGKRIPTAGALLVPALLLLLGLAGMISGLEAAIAAIGQASDPAWVPWFALDDRARAAGPGVLGGAAAAVLALPPGLGAAWLGVRAKEGLPRSRRAFGLAAALVYAGCLATAGVAAAVLLDDARVLLAPALGAPPLVVAAVVAAGRKEPRSFPGVATAAGALGIGAAGLALAATCWAALGTSAGLGDFSAPYSAMGGVIAATHRAEEQARVAGALGVLAILGGVPAVLLRDWRRLDPRAGLDVLVCAGVGMLVVLAGGWTAARVRVLSSYAGAHAAAVLQENAGYAVPARAPVPSRVLVGGATSPRWLMLRERGGLDRLPIAGGLDIVGPALLRNDGLMLPPDLALEDLYLALFESEAGTVSIVGCDATPPALLSEIASDPLLATGRCAAFPLVLRVTGRLPEPRVLIALKDGWVDDAGDVVRVADVGNVAGKDVIVRGQVDATMADLVSLLRVLADAGTVYLGYGVTLDGDDLPIGVDPGLRISKLPQERAAEEAARAAEAAAEEEAKAAEPVSVPAGEPAGPAKAKPRPKSAIRAKKAKSATSAPAWPPTEAAAPPPAAAPAPAPAPVATEEPAGKKRKRKNKE